MTDTLPFQKHSDTSREAAAESAVHAPNMRRRVYDYIQRHGPCSDQNVQSGLTMNPNTERPRRIELESAGHVRSSGNLDTGAVVYVVTTKP